MEFGFYRARPLYGGDDVTGRQPGCGRDFDMQEHGSRGLKGSGEWAWQLQTNVNDALTQCSLTHYTLEVPSGSEFGSVIDPNPEPLGTSKVQ